MSELRDYVLEKFSGGQEYSREDITKFINQKFGKEHIHRSNFKICYIILQNKIK